MYKKVYKKKKTAIGNSEIMSATKKEKLLAEYISLLSELREKERIVRKIISEIRESLDLNQVLQTTAEDIGKLFGAERCRIALLDPVNSKFHIKNEYKISENIPSFPESQDKDTLPHNWQECLFINKSPVLINDAEAQHLNIEENNFLKLRNLKSLIIIPIAHKEDILGIIAVCNIHSKKDWEISYIDILKDISHQIAVAIKQAELYSNIKKQAEREKLLRKITETIRSSLNIDDVFNIICKEIAEVFNVEKSSIVEIVDHNDQKTQYIFRYAYKSREDVIRSSEFDFDPRTHDYWKKVLFDDEEMLIINNLSQSNTPDYFKSNYECMNVKSILGIGIKKDNDKWGAITLQKVDECKYWTQDDIILLKMIADQVYIAIKHAELYTETKKQAEREYLLRTIISATRSSFNINEIKQTIVNEIGRTLDADRCIIHEVEAGIDPHNYIEYLSSPDLIGFKDINLEDSGVKALIRIHTKEKKEIIAYDVNKYLKENNLEETTLVKHVKQMNIKSALGIPIMNGNEAFGILIIHFTRKKFLFSDKDLEFIRTLANQLGIAIHKSRLYLTLKQIDEREKLLKQIITTIRNTIDIKESLKPICKLIAKLFNVDRVFVVDFPDKKNFREFIIKQEYKSCERLVGISDTKFDKKMFEYWGNEIFVKKTKIILNNLSESDLPCFIKKKYTQLGIKSILALPIKGNEIWGILSLSQYSYYREWTREEIKLLEVISDQIYLAFLQSEMYSKITKQIETESLIKADNSIIVNRNLAQNIGLSCATSYCAIANMYYYLKDEGKITVDGYFLSNINDLLNITFLSIQEQKEAIQKLAELSLIHYKEDKSDKIYLKISENDNILKKYISNEKIPNRNQKTSEKEKIFYEISELCDIYSKYYTKNSVQCAKYFINKNKLVHNDKSSKITRQYFGIICRTMHDFMKLYSLSFNTMKSIIDEWFNAKPSKKNKRIIDFGLSNKILVNRLEKTLFYRLQEAKILATDTCSKLDFYSNTDFSLYNQTNTENDEE
ncbi:MAG: GAF sensor hybrid histidine kinase [uncultured bacterium]|nr:MAG: GAF sensor hybrid histidine kinase [uncultured bacterium]HBH19261.1 hypothetical protein [Cyanobacteria bacterium UBA9579]